MVVIILLIYFKKEKKILHKKIQEWQKKDINNQYFSFITECSTKSYGPEDGPLHTHHIIPKYAFNDTPEDREMMDQPENLMKLSQADHLEAHRRLSIVFGNPQDRGAMTLLSGDIQAGKKEWHQMGAKASHQVQKEKGVSLWNFDQQKEMAKRSMANPNALEYRSQGGKIGGVNRNLDRVITASDRYVFSFNGVEVLCIFNCRTGGPIVEQLNLFHPTKLERVTELLKGTRKSLYGWSCRKLNVETDMK